MTVKLQIWVEPMYSRDRPVKAMLAMHFVTGTDVIMKVALVALTFAATAYAADLPQCAQTCLNNMYAKAKELDCKGSNDYSCLCDSIDFWYGIRDCINQACSGEGLDEANKVAKEACPSATQSSAVSTETGTESTSVSVTSTASDDACTSTTDATTNSIPTTASLASGFNDSVVTVTETKSGEETAFVTTIPASKMSESGKGGVRTITETFTSGSQALTITTTIPATITGGNPTASGSSTDSDTDSGTDSEVVSTITTSSAYTTKPVVSTESASSGSEPVTTTLGQTTLFSEVVAAETAEASATDFDGDKDSAASSLTANPLAILAGIAALFAL
ncbi:hypothetical protein KEM54_000161 [Ascosphaera aggregata]|nr:hypothetical protein KEM54_000161 [Ascosphaera aggregata]